MDFLLLIIFVLVGIAGLIFKVETGVFVGLGLFPWQILKLKMNKKLILTSIISAGIIGSIYFIMQGEWLIFALFIFIQSYNYWGFLNLDRS